MAPSGRANQVEFPRVPNYGFAIDLKMCIGCHACTIACKSEHDIPIGVNRCWVKTVEKGSFPDTARLFLPMLCNQCEEAPCMKICPTSALYDKVAVIENGQIKEYWTVTSRNRKLTI